MRSVVSYIPYATASHEQTGDILTFANFEENNSVENKRNLEEDESIFSLVVELSIYNDSDDGYISTNALEDIHNGSQINPDIDARSAILKICDYINQTQIEWKAAELSEKNIG